MDERRTPPSVSVSEDAADCFREVGRARDEVRAGGVIRQPQRRSGVVTIRSPSRVRPAGTRLGVIHADDERASAFAWNVGTPDAQFPWLPNQDPASLAQHVSELLLSLGAVVADSCICLLIHKLRQEVVK